MGTVFRVLFGLLLACLVAGLVQVMFVVTPKDLASLSGAALSERLGFAGMQVLFAATLAAMFAAPFALVAAAIGEWMGWRSPTFYLLVGVLIALAGFSAQFASESPGQATIVNNYALKAFLTAGFFAGFAYWLVAGRGAGGAPDEVAPVTPAKPMPAKPSTPALASKPATTAAQPVAHAVAHNPAQAAAKPAPPAAAPSMAAASKPAEAKPAAGPASPTPAGQPKAVQPLIQNVARPAGSVPAAGATPKKT